MRKHCIKILEDYADAVYEGEKTFEIRENDRGYQKGDLVNFIVLYRDYCAYREHPLNSKYYEITYVYSGKYIDKDYVVFGIKPYKE